MGCETTLRGFDNNGSVRLDGDRVLRAIDAAYRGTASRLLDLFERHRLADLGFVETSAVADGGAELAHTLYPISYPHEWPAALLKRAALFHLDLLARLEPLGLTLKDALPENVCFDGTTPRFVDFLSLVETERLGDEDWLRTAPGARDDLRRTVLLEMFVPYFVLPLAAHAFGRPDLSRHMLRHQACNMPGHKPHQRQVLEAVPFMASLRIRRLLRAVDRAIARPFPEAWREVSRIVAALPAVSDSGYASYYAAKAEDFPLDDRADWRPKQLSVAGALDRDRPASVLDLGANTGWFSQLAAHMGAKVTSLDIDEPSLSVLAENAAEGAAHVLPLLIGFGALESGLDSSGHPTDDPCAFAPPLARFAADTTLMLGLIHHLALGEGRSLEAIMDVLARSCRKSAIVEFVDLTDPLIAGNPGYFPALSRWSAESYSLDRVIAAASAHFGTIETAPSHPDSRTILHLRKEG